ncbi:MAG TPA: hypothetical protein VGN52_25150 [Burkholderiales bacterium]|jgi:hypothetical protein
MSSLSFNPGDHSGPPPAHLAALAARTSLKHSEFVAAYTSGRLKVTIAPKAASRFVSGRAMLPWLLLPLFGFAAATALVGSWTISVIFFVGALALRAVTHMTAPGYILHRALSDATFYYEVRGLGLLRTEGS